MEFKQYLELEDISTQICTHISHAMLIDSVRTEGSDTINPNTCDEIWARYILARSIEFSDIIFDYLNMLEKESQKLKSLVEEILKSYRKSKEKVTTE